MQSENRVAMYLEQAKQGTSSVRSGSLDRINAQLRHTLHTVEKQVGKHPALAVALGASAGLILGWMIKRQ